MENHTYIFLFFISCKARRSRGRQQVRAVITHSLHKKLWKLVDLDTNIPQKIEESKSSGETNQLLAQTFHRKQRGENSILICLLSS